MFSIIECIECQISSGIFPFEILTFLNSYIIYENSQFIKDYTDPGYYCFSLVRSHYKN